MYCFLKDLEFNEFVLGAIEDDAPVDPGVDAVVVAVAVVVEVVAVAVVIFVVLADGIAVDDNVAAAAAGVDAPATPSAIVVTEFPVVTVVAVDSTTIITQNVKAYLCICIC